MNRYIIGSLWDRANRNGANKNFEYLFEGSKRIDALNNRADNILSKSNATLNEAKQTNNMNKDVQSQINTLIAESGTSDAEVLQARIDADGNEYTVLKDRLDNKESETGERLTENERQLDKTYSASETFDPLVVARESGRHIAFGTIENVAKVSDVELLNINLIAYRDGINHRNDGKIKGVYVSDEGYAMGEPFLIAQPSDYANLGRGGIKTPNDFRDPNLKKLPDGRILLTFFAINFEADDSRTQLENYAMLGTFNETYRTISWTAPQLLLNRGGVMLYGKPVVEGNYVYSAAYEGEWTGKPDNTYKGYVLRAPLSDPLSWSIIGDPVWTHDHYLYTEPIFRLRPGGGYFIQARGEGQGNMDIVRFDANTLMGVWSEPSILYTGSAHAKGLEFFDDGSYFTGIRLNTERPGIAILTTEGKADIPSPLQLSGVVSSSIAGSNEGSYMEFLKVNEEEYLATFFTETGRTIQCARFTVAMIKNKLVKEEDSAFPMKRQIGAERINPFIHLGNHATRSHNLLTNPTFYIPYGFDTAPGWGQRLQKSDGTETDSPGEGYTMSSSSGTNVTSKPKLPYSRVFEGMPIVGGARIYCKTPNRVRLILTYGSQRVSVHHSGNGWEVLPVIIKHRTGYSSFSSGTKNDQITFGISVSAGDPVDVYFDWASLGFGETIPEIINDSVERLFSIARLPLTSKTNTFTLNDLGFASPQLTYNIYPVNILSSNFEILGYSVSRTSTSFTITLADGTQWGSNKFAEVELIGLS